MRDLFTARLVRKLLLSEAAQCFHLEFTLEGAGGFRFEPGQFVSCVAVDSRGKQQTRAYSLASAPRGDSFDFCLNRVEDGFFSNLLCDLEVGQTIEMHGPHGMFTLHEPARNGLLVAADTGIAPIRGFVQWLFPHDGPDRSGGRPFTLIHSNSDEADLYYRDEFEKLAAKHANFDYLPVLDSGGPDWTGARGTAQQHAALLFAQQHTPAATSAAEGVEVDFELYAYICGLNAIVAPCRQLLRDAGASRKQIVFERYD